MPDRLNHLSEHIAAAIGGRSAALSFEKASHGKFRRHTLQRWIDGKTWPDAAELMELADATGKPLSFFFPPESPKNPLATLAAQKTVVIDIPVLDVEAAAGAGMCDQDAAQIDTLTLPRLSIEKIGGSPRHVECLRARGESMEPTITDGALVLVDRSMTTLRPALKPGQRKRSSKHRPDDDLYVFFQRDEGVRLKRLRNIPTGLVILSDNPEYEPEVLSLRELGDITVLGRVVWWDNRL